MDSFPSRLLITLVLVFIIVLLQIALSAIDNVSEARLSKLAEEGNKKAKSALKRLENTSKTSSSLKITSNLATLLSSGFVYTLALTIIENYQLGSYSLAVIIACYVILALIIQLFGIYFPKKLTAKKPENIMFSLMWLINLTCIICMPLERTLYAFSSLIFKPLGSATREEEDDDDVTEEDIRFMVDIGSESGAIDPDEKEMIHNIFELDDTPIRDIMTHRTDVEFLWKEENIDVWEETIARTNHQIYPVCGESVDDILGLIKTTDFYKLLRNSKDNEINIDSIIKAPYLVPESIKADDLFRQMQKNKNHFAIVLDEYGGLGGIISMSDLLEEIVGDLDNDINSSDEEDIVQLDTNTWRILGSTDIDVVSEALDIDLPVEEFNTFAGMILSELGEIPEDGSTVEVEAYGLQIRVTKISEHRIDEAVVCKIEPEKTED